MRRAWNLLVVIASLMVLHGTTSPVHAGTQQLILQGGICYDEPSINELFEDAVERDTGIP